jgi:hypothetical protein
MGTVEHNVNRHRVRHLLVDLSACQPKFFQC